MQDLLLAQKRDRPAYCFQHRHLELRSHHDDCRASFAAAGATLAPRHDVVACFEPEWNSLRVNKTRSFNILGVIRNTGTDSIAAFAPAKQSPRRQPCAGGGEVFVISVRRFCRQPLENQQIEFPALCRRSRSTRRGLCAAEPRHSLVKPGVGRRIIVMTEHPIIGSGSHRYLTSFAAGKS